MTTQAPLLQTESGTLGAQVEGKTVQEMPLNGRNVTNLISLVPGVVPQGSSMGNTTMNQGTHTNNAGWGNFQIGGAITGYGTMYLDGAPLNGMYGNFVGYVPTQDSIQEFKVSTNSVSAEFGRFGGGVVEMTTKSGTNQFHGTAYEYCAANIPQRQCLELYQQGKVAPEPVRLRRRRSGHPGQGLLLLLHGEVCLPHGRIEGHQRARRADDGGYESQRRRKSDNRCDTSCITGRLPQLRRSV